MTNNLLPGMNSDGLLEFFVVENEVKVMHSGKIETFADTPFDLFQLLKETINNDPLVLEKLTEMHPTSEYRRIEQFVKCRFGGLDYQGDFCTKERKLQDGEYWPCPKHGSCSAEGILCKLPIVNGERLTKQEVQLVKLSTTDMKNEVIAEEMNLPLGTFHKMKHILYQKLGNIQTKQCLTKLAIALNII